MKHRWWLFVGCIWVHSVAAEFKYSMPLVTEEEATAYQLNVPATVYQNVKNADLRDVRVLNAAGDEVPMRLSKNQDQIERSWFETTLPVFSLQQTSQLPVTTKQVRTTLKGDKKDFTVSTSSSIQRYVENLESAQLDKLLIDASLIKGKQSVALELIWAFAAPGNRVFFVELMGSNDLAQWQTVLSHQKMIELNTGSNLVLENRLPLADQSFDYYQLRFKNQPIPVVLEVKAIMLKHQVNQQLQWSTLNKFDVLDPAKNAHAIEWDLGGYYPLEAIKIDFDYRNLMAEVRLFSKYAKDSVWRPVAMGSVYSLGEGEMSMFNNQLSFKPNNHRYWKLTSQSDITAQWVNKISYAWRQHQIQFLAQGAGPYALNYGASGFHYQPSEQWYETLTQTMKQNMFSEQISTGEPQVILPKKVIKKPVEKTFNYSRWVFWGLLVLVLTGLGFMAVRLLKEVESGSNDK